MERYIASSKGKQDIHTKLMKTYKDILSWWFHLLLGVTLMVSLVLCIFLSDQVQMPWWGLLYARLLTFGLTLPISIITATANSVKILLLFLPSALPKKKGIIKYQLSQKFKLLSGDILLVLYLIFIHKKDEYIYTLISFLMNFIPSLNYLDGQLRNFLFSCVL